MARGPPGTYGHWMLRPALLALVLLAATPTVATAAPGAIDTAYSGDGKVTVNFGGAERLTAMALQADGKAVLGGIGPNNTFALARLTSIGALDTAFSGDGRLTTTWPQATGARLHSVYVQPDGKVMAAGVGWRPDVQIEGGTATFVAIARYTAGGGLDTTYGGDGRVEALSTCDDCGSV